MYPIIEFQERSFLLPTIPVLNYEARRSLGKKSNQKSANVEINPLPSVCACEQVYQVYARRSPEEVHSILRAAGADYVVLENSICYERRHRRGCRLRDLLDLANGHVGGAPLT